ncbi:hypothetical protein [Lysobacter enzymogenes]|uniref:hypothetical protein n=1 Tax=Lysobacter enzymogenes TaxID=69 RepID=UPI001117852B|nr:hypothetical protein [Lysobacter enzymogenes]UZW62359.1 hypothetical protein BV903_008755 [Lysobacter enzymogenes]
MSAAETFNYQPTFAALVPVCKAHGIGKTLAYQLASKGDLKTFLLHGKRMVYLASLESLPNRVAANERKGGDACR